MTIQFRWTESDYFAAQLAWLYRRPWEIVVQFKYAIGWVCIIAAALIMKPQEWRNELLGLILAVLLAMPETIRTCQRWHRHFKKAFSTNTDNVATIDERGVTLATQGQQKTHSWAEFSRIYESRRVVVLEKDADHLLFLPKSAMSGAHLDELRRLAIMAPNCRVRLASPAG